MVISPWRLQHATAGNSACWDRQYEPSVRCPKVKPHVLSNRFLTQIHVPMCQRNKAAYEFHRLTIPDNQLAYAVVCR